MIVYANIFTGHVVNSSSKWGLGDYPYGNVIRQARVFDAVKDRNLPGLVRKILREDIKPGPILDTETAFGYSKAAVAKDSLPTQRVSELYRMAVGDLGLESGDT